MRPKSPYPSALKLILLSLFFLILLLLLLLRSTSPQTNLSRTIIPPTNYHQKGGGGGEEELVSMTRTSALSTERPSTSPPPNHDLDHNPRCTKIAPNLAEALVHYATSNITPQQTLKDISVTLRVLAKKSPCNLLVFGLGHDSLMWASLNHGGRTVFLEEDKSWIEQIRSGMPSLESYHVSYDTRVTQADELLKVGMSEGACKEASDPRFSECELSLKGFPDEIYEVEWDLIMVDAPTGYHDGAPGRMSAIYTAGLMARNRESGETDVFVHDVDRVVEDKFSKAFLCQGYLREQEGRIRHFTLPSHRTRSGRPFCPEENSPGQ